MVEKQQTLSKIVTITGKGLHTGAEVKVTLNPAAEDTGINFCRTDLEGAPIVAALAENVTNTARSTTIEKRGVSICTIEHLMAALWGGGIDNALVEIDGPEVPILDGSAALWVDLVASAGITPQQSPRKYYEISEKITYTDPERGVEVTAYPDERFSALVSVDFNSQVVGCQYATLNSSEEFNIQIAPCRTFVFMHEIEPLIGAGLIKGGDLDNAIVIVEEPLPADKAAHIASMFNRSNIGADTKGYLQNLTLHYDNEIARHKMLDLMGDLALVGMRIRGRIFASRPGHSANTEFAKMLRKAIRRDQDRPTYRYNPGDTPVYDINQIKALLPHRPPFLLVDKIMRITESEVVGIKNVTMNEPFFVGHFPEEPVMPGVLIVEAMAQCGGILALSTLPDPENYSTYFMTIDGVKYRQKVVPGDTLLFILSLDEPVRRGIVKMSAKAYVGDKLATEAHLMAMISKNK